MIKWIFDRLKSPSTHIFEVDAPWRERESIYACLEVHLDQETGRLRDYFDRLPDEPERDPDGFRWAPGALDGVMGHHVAGDETIASSTLVELIVQVAQAPTAGKFARLYDALCDGAALSTIDDVLDGLVEATPEPPMDLHALAVRLATQAPDRNAVKFGMALLGLVAEPEDQPILMTLGAHEEFTLFAIVAIRNAFEDSERAIWRLAKSVDGWGRIHAVEHLAETSDADIKDWMLRQGYRNSVMYEYLALICARTGDLAGALDATEVDESLLVGAGDILEALVSPMGPAGDIDGYEGAAQAVAGFLKHLRFAEPNLDLLSSLISIGAFLDDGGDCWEFSSECGWSDERVDALRTEADALLARQGWVEVVERGLRTEDRREFSLACDAAPKLGIDPWEQRFERLQDGDNQWYWVMQTDDVDRVDRVISLAQTTLDLDAIASGPGTSMGLGPEWKQHSALDFIVQDLRRFPGRGWTLVATALRSPVTRNRHMALKALDAWGPTHWPPNARVALERAGVLEPVADVRGRIEALLEHGQLPDE